MARKPHFDYDLIVIGSGAAGSTAALTTARAGKKVAVIEAHEFGGESPNWGDIPTKTLMHVAEVYDTARHGARFGIRSSTLGYNYPSILKWKDVAIRRTGAGGNRKYYESQGIDTYHGRAHFLSPHEVSVARKRLSAHHFLVATGSHFTLPDYYGIDTVTPLTPQTLLSQPRPPKSIFVVGADSTGVELAQLLATFGTKVYLSDVSGRILPDEDEEVGHTMQAYLEKHHDIICLPETQVNALEKRGLGMRITYTRGGAEHTVHVNELLVTTHRTPTTDLGLENAHVEYTPRGIDTNEHLQTNARHIYAAGTVLGDNQPTHIALLQGRAVAHNILRKNKITPDYHGAPRITFTYPNIASVGLAEDDCIKRDLTIKQAMAPLALVSRSNTSDFRDGFVKIITDTKGVIIGATIMAPHAAEMIQELSLAIRHELTAHQIATTPHAFLSWSEAVRVAAAKLV